MKISIDATGLGEVKTGTGVYVSEVLRCWNADKAIEDEFIIFANPGAVQYLLPLELDARFRFIVAPECRWIRGLWQQSVLVWLLRQQRVHVHWGTGFVLPILTRSQTVVTIHDLSFQLFPEVHERFKRYYFPLMINLAVRKAASVLAVSQTTASDLGSFLPAAKGKTVVTRLAPRRLDGNGAVWRTNTLPASPYILFVGTLEPRKNLISLLAAWQMMTDEQRAGMHLLVVGSPGWMMEHRLKPYRHLDQSVCFTGFVSDDELGDLIRGALLLAYPSLYEGFGLPVIEAMSLGVPVLTSSVGATQEVAKDAAWLVDPTSVDQIRGGLIRLVSDDALRQRLMVRGRERAGEFSWSKTAQATIDVLHQNGRRIER